MTTADMQWLAIGLLAAMVGWRWVLLAVLAVLVVLAALVLVPIKAVELAFLWLRKVTCSAVRRSASKPGQAPGESDSSRPSGSLLSPCGASCDECQSRRGEGQPRACPLRSRQ